MRESKTWVEAGQPFVRDGLCIRTLKPGMLKLAYGDERLRVMKAEQAAALPPSGRIRRAVSFLLSSRPLDPSGRVEL
jgi:hypothetical protein